MQPIIFRAGLTGLLFSIDTIAIKRYNLMENISIAKLKNRFSGKRFQKLFNPYGFI